MEDTIDDSAETQLIRYEAGVNVSDILWKQSDGRPPIRLGDMEDSHLRNAALMLMGLGYQKWHGPDYLKIRWLTVMRMEWEKRHPPLLP